MHHSSPRTRDNAAEAAVVIERPVAEVFNFYRDFENLPRFLGDVMATEQIGPDLSRWTIEGPLGVRLHTKVKLTEERPNELIRYETTASLPGLKTHAVAGKFDR